MSVRLTDNILTNAQIWEGPGQQITCKLVNRAFAPLWDFIWSNNREEVDMKSDNCRNWMRQQPIQSYLLLQKTI